MGSKYADKVAKETTEEQKRKRKLAPFWEEKKGIHKIIDSMNKMDKREKKDNLIEAEGKRKTREQLQAALKNWTPEEGRQTAENIELLRRDLYLPEVYRQIEEKKQKGGNDDGREL